MTALASPQTRHTPQDRHAQIEADRETLAGPELNIRVSLSPRVILFLAAPAAVGLSLLVGWALLRSFALPLHAPELLAAAIINLLGGTLAVLPLFFRMKHGAVAIAQSGLMGIAIRCAVVFGGLVLAFGPGWQLDKMPLVYWTLACYFPMLMAETALIAWLSHRAKF